MHRVFAATRSGDSRGPSNWQPAKVIHRREFLPPGHRLLVLAAIPIIRDGNECPNGLQGDEEVFMGLEEVQGLPSQAEDPGSKAVADLLNSVLAGQVEAVEATLPQEPPASDATAQGRSLRSQPGG